MYCKKRIMKFLCFLIVFLGTDLLMPDSICAQNNTLPVKYTRPRPFPGQGPVYEWNGLFEGEWPDDSTIIIIPLRCAATTQSNSIDSTELDGILEGVISYTNQTITHQFFENIGIIKICVIDEYGFIHVGKYIDTNLVSSDEIDISILPECRFSIYCVIEGEKYYYNFTIEE